MKKIVITGSEGLIGSELCRYLEKRNKVIRLDLKLSHDLSDENFVKQWFKNNHADYLVNCFALNDHITNSRIKKDTLFDMSLDSLMEYLGVNIVSLFSVCREFAKNTKSGAIVNFSTIYGLVSPNPALYSGYHKNIGYGVSKAGVINLTKYLAVHLAPKIRVNCVIPGGVLANQDKKFVKAYSKLTPMKRMMNVKELNSIVEYLCSDESSYVTGSMFVVDGGYTIW